MTETDRPPLSLVEAKDQARTRDAGASPFRVSHTDPASFCADVIADFALGVIDDNVVRLAIAAAPATLEEVYGDVFVPGGNRATPLFSSKYVIASYFSRARLVALSVYCGVSWIAKAAPTPANAQLTRDTAMMLSQTLNRVKGVLKSCPSIEQRGGGVYIDDGSDPWLARYMTAIDNPPSYRCATCGEEIYYANDDWRHTATKRAEVMKDVPRGGRIVKNIDHVADPAIEWRKS